MFNHRVKRDADASDSVKIKGDAGRGDVGVDHGDGA
jgi:hypothetical protein